MWCLSDTFNLFTIKPKTSMVYEPHKWNDPARVEKSNCYAYALDEPDLGWMWPGSRLDMPDAPVPAALRDLSYGGLLDARMEYEGLERIHKHAFDPARHHIIAFTYGFAHFYRLDADRTWSHKPGSSPVCNTGYDGLVIQDVERSRLRPFGPAEYDICYYRVPEQGIVTAVRERRQLTFPGR